MPSLPSLGVTALALALLPGSSFAAPSTGDDDPFGRDDGSRWRLGFSGGVTSPVDVDPAAGGVIEYDNGFLFGASLGYHLGDLSDNLAVWLEVEALTAEADVDEDVPDGSKCRSLPGAVSLLPGVTELAPGCRV